MTNYKDLKTYQKSQINGLTKHLASLRFGVESRSTGNDAMINRAIELGMQVDYNDSNMNGEKFTFLKPRKITAEQSKYGKAWLRNFFFKLDGTARSGQRTQYVSDSVLKIAKNVKRFEFIGVLGVANSGSWDIMSFLPVYRAYNAKGEYFDYSPVHWGQPIIME